MIKIKSVTDVITNSSSEVFLIKMKDGVDIEKFQEELAEYIQKEKDLEHVHYSGECCGIEFPYIIEPWGWGEDPWLNLDDMEKWKEKVTKELSGYDPELFAKLDLDALAKIEKLKHFKSSRDPKSDRIRVDNGFMNILPWIIERADLKLEWHDPDEPEETFNVGDGINLVFDGDKPGYIRPITEEEKCERLKSKIQYDYRPSVYGTPETMKNWVEANHKIGNSVSPEDWVREALEDGDRTINNYKESLKNLEEKRKYVESFLETD